MSERNGEWRVGKHLSERESGQRGQREQSKEGEECGGHSIEYYWFPSHSSLSLQYIKSLVTKKLYSNSLASRFLNVNQILSWYTTSNH